MKFASIQNMRYPKTSISVLLILILLIANFRIITTDEQKAIYEPSVEHLTSICGAIAALHYGQSRYICPKEIYRKIEMSKAYLGSPQSADASIKEAMELKNVNFEDGILAGIASGNGYVDFVCLSFLLFGFKIVSLVYLYFLILNISIAVFWLTCRRNSLGLLFLAIFLLSHYIIIKMPPYFDFGWQLGSVINYRFLPVLTILPTIHILMVSLSGQRLTGRAFAGVLIQSMIIVFILWIRGSIIWIGLLFICAIVLKIFFNVWRSRVSSEKGHQEDLTGISGIMRTMRVWPIVPFLSMFLFLIIGKSFIFGPEFKKREGMGHHVVWHSVYAGLALHPDIRKSYSTASYDGMSYGKSRGERVHGPTCSDQYMRGHPMKVAVKKWLCADAQRWLFEIIYALKHPIEYMPSDQDSFSASFKWLYDNGYSEYEVFNFRPEDDVDYKGSFQWFNQSSEMNKKRPFQIIGDYNYSRHDSIMKDVVKDVIRTHPLQVAQNIFLDKPLRFFLACSRYISFTSLSIWCLFIVLLLHFFMMEVERFRNETFQILKLLSLIFVFSLIPVFCVYPADYLIANTVLILIMAILFTIFMLLIPMIYEGDSKI